MLSLLADEDLFVSSIERIRVEGQTTLFKASHLIWCIVLGRSSRILPNTELVAYDGGCLARLQILESLELTVAAH